jgi:hypothetical protein
MDVWMVFSVLGLIGKKNLSIGKKILFDWQKELIYFDWQKKTSQLAKRSYSIGKKTFSHIVYIHAYSMY